MMTYQPNVHLSLQFCTLVNDSAMTCLAPGLVYNKPEPPDGALQPDEFGFIFDQVTLTPGVRNISAEAASSW